MKKIKFLIVPIFLVLLGIILAACSKTFRISGDLDVLEPLPYQYLKDENNNPYIKVKPGTKLVFKVDPAKLNKGKSVHLYQIIKKDTITNIQTPHTEVADTDIIFKVVYHETTFHDFKLSDSDKKAYDILDIKKIINNEVKALDKDDVQIKDNIITKIKGGLKLSITIKKDHPYLIGKELLSLNINNDIYNDLSKPIIIDVISALKISFNTEELNKLSLSYDEAKFSEYNISILNDLDKTYALDIIKFDLSKIKSIYKKTLKTIKVNEVEYELNNELLEVPTKKEDKNISIELVVEEELPSKITYTNDSIKEMFNFYIKRNNQGEYQLLTIPFDLYKNDQLKITTNKSYRQKEANIAKTTTKVMLNDISIGQLNDKGENADVEYENLLSEKNKDYHLSFEEKPLTEKLIKLSATAKEHLKATYRLKKYSDDFKAYPYQEISFEVIKDIPEGQVVEGLYFNNQEIYSEDKHIYKFIMPNIDEEYNINYKIGDSKDYYKLSIKDIFKSNDDKKTLVDNTIISTKYYKKDTTHKLSINSEYYKYKYLLVNGNKVEINNTEYEFKLENHTEIVIKDDALIPHKVRINLNISSDILDLFELVNIQNGANLLDYNQEFSIKAKENQFELTNFLLNGVNTNTVNNEITLKATFDVSSIEITMENNYKLVNAKLTIDNQDEIVMPSAIKKLEDNTYIVRKDYEYEFKVKHTSNFKFYKYIFNQEDNIVNSSKITLTFNANDKLVVDKFSLVEQIGALDRLTSENIDNAFLKANITGFGELVDHKKITADQVIFNSTNKKFYFINAGNASLYIKDSNKGYILNLNIKWKYDVEFISINPNQLKNSVSKLTFGNSNLIRPIKELKLTLYNSIDQTMTTQIVDSDFAKYISTELEFELVDNKTNTTLTKADYDVSKDAITLKKEYEDLTIKYKDKKIEHAIIKNGHNAYSQTDLYELYKNSDITNIYLLKDIKLQVNKTHTQTEGKHPNYKELAKDHTLSEEKRLKYEQLKDHSEEDMLMNRGSASYFSRDFNNSSKDFFFEGNGFTIDAKGTPFPDIKSGDWAPGGADSVCDVAFGIFHGDFSSTNIPKAIAHFKNINILSNTSLPDNDADPASTVSAWASGGMHGFLFYTRLSIDNATIKKATLGVMSRQGSLTLKNSIIDECWANSVLYSNAVDSFTLANEPKYNGFIAKAEFINNDFKKSGGASVFMIDYSRGKRGDKNSADTIKNDREKTPQERDKIASEYNYDLNDPISCSSYSYDPECYFENNTYDNFIDGTSSYYRANKIPADQIITKLTEYFKKLNAAGIKKSHVKKISTPKGDKLMMNFAMFFQNPALALADEPNNMEYHHQQAFDIRYKQTNNSIIRTYRSSYYKNSGYIAPLTLTSGFIQGAGYDLNKAMEILCEAMSIDFNKLGSDPNELLKYQNAYSAALARSFTGALHPSFSPIEGSIPNKTEFSQRFFELHMGALTPTIKFSCFPLIEMLDENVPA